jgi:hypothetical protein
MTMLEQFIDNFSHNLFKPLFLFFYFGFLLPLLKVPFDFPLHNFQGVDYLTLDLHQGHSGEKLASFSSADPLWQLRQFWWP